MLSAKMAAILSQPQCVNPCFFPVPFKVIVERYHKETQLPQLDKTKFLVPQELTMSQFVTIIR